MVQCLRECSDEIPRLQMWCLSLRRCVTGTEPNWTTIEPPMTRAEASAARTSNRKLQEGSKTQCHFCSYTCIRKMKRTPLRPVMAQCMEMLTARLLPMRPLMKSMEPLLSSSQSQSMQRRTGTKKTPTHPLLKNNLAKEKRVNRRSPVTAAPSVPSPVSPKVPPSSREGHIPENILSGLLNVPHVLKYLQQSGT